MSPIRTIEAALWLTAAACVIAGLIHLSAVARTQTSALAVAESAWPAAVEAPDRSLWDHSRKARYEAAAKTAPPATIAVLKIPVIGLEVAVFDGTEPGVLDLGVGRIPGTSPVGAGGNLALAGHRDGFFRGLKGLEPGDEIVVEHRQGTERFSVLETSVVSPDDISVLAPTEGASVTLVTCYPFYVVGPAPMRFIVRAQARNT